MPMFDTKIEILGSSGYIYSIKRMVYYNRKARKVFSVEAVEDQDENWLQEHIGEENGSLEWRFYFNTTPSEAVQRKLVSELE